MSNNNNDQQKYLAQWIISLGVSVVCCAALFIIFAVYIMNVHDKAAITAIRLEILQDRQNQMIAQIDSIIRVLPRNVRNNPVPVNANAVAVPQPEAAQPQPVAVPEAMPQPQGVTDNKTSNAQPAETPAQVKTETKPANAEPPKTGK